MNSVTIVSKSGSMTVDFDNKTVFLNRQGFLAQAAGLTNMTISFKDISDIELRQPSFSTLGCCNIIINGIRYVTPGGIGDATNFAVSKNDFNVLESTLKRILLECNIQDFKMVNSVNANRVVYVNNGINQTMSNAAQFAFNEKKAETQETGKFVDEVTEAKMFAQSVELQLLKAPATAKFCNLNEMTATNANGIYTISGYVDSQNSYGAMIRTPFTLHVMKDESGWKSIDRFESTQASVGKTVAKNMAVFWIIGIIISIVTFFIFYAIIKSRFGL